MNRTILIVEDNYNNRLLMSDILNYHGYTVLEAKNGADGVEEARKHGPDLVLMDIQMPIMDGFTAAKILKDDPLTRQLRLIALTSFAMLGDRERILAAGFDGYIAKPIDIRQLSAIVKKHLGTE